MEESLLKLKNTNTKDAFRYGYLLNKMYPYIKNSIGTFNNSYFIGNSSGFIGWRCCFFVKTLYGLCS